MLIFSVRLQSDVLTHAGSDRAVRKLVRRQLPKTNIFLIPYFLCFETKICFPFQTNQMTKKKQQVFTNWEQIMTSLNENMVQAVSRSDERTLEDQRNQLQQSALSSRR